MLIIYNLYILLTKWGISLASLFNPKAKQWIGGRRGLLKKIESQYEAKEKTLWVHAASLGEFEQGRPLIEKFKEDNPDYQIIVTFFSPSGYEIRKDYEGADYVFYLPVDTPANARKFISLIRPTMVMFVKYEFWYHFLKELKRQDIPTYLVSAVFRKEHLFFKSYGGWYRKMLHFFKHIFVQDSGSLQLLQSIGVAHTSISGDTRFDRVGQITDNVKPIPIAEKFKGQRQMFIAGSSWPADEEIFCRYINEESPENICWLIAPHEIDDAHIKKIIKLIDPKKKTIRYSEANEENVQGADVLIIDNIGLLSSLYAYGDIAHIGGGFTDGIHNTLEAATFGMPITFGPDYHKFNEAIELIDIGGAFCINNYQEFKPLLDTWISNAEKRELAARKSADYVQNNRGATSKVLGQLGLS